MKIFGHIKVFKMRQISSTAALLNECRLQRKNNITESSVVLGRRSFIAYSLYE